MTDRTMGEVRRQAQTVEALERIARQLAQLNELTALRMRWAAAHRGDEAVRELDALMAEWRERDYWP